MNRPPLASVAERLPTFFGSIRVRLTFLYSVLLFGLAAIVVGLIYLGLARSLDDEPVSRRWVLTTTVDGRVVDAREVIVPDLDLFEREVNRRAMEQLRTYSFGALGLLFVGSLGVGWFVSGLVLRPIGRITRVAKEIQATDLSRRIDMRGPNDEIRQLADTFDEMLGRLDEAFESQRQFIQEASHELRNPIAVIRANVDVALADPDASPDELRETVNVVNRAAGRMSTLVDDLLAYARHGMPNRRDEVVDLAVVVEDVVAEFRASAASAGIGLEHSAAPEAWVRGDRVALQRALANLLANAIRETGRGTTVRVAAGREAAWAWLTVADQGPGIAPADKERVFQRFWRGDHSRARSEGRSGLGLTIVRQIATAHGGRVDVHSEPGKGATFVIWLPAAPAVDRGGPGHAPVAPADAAPAGSLPAPPAEALTRAFGGEA